MLSKRPGNLTLERLRPAGKEKQPALLTASGTFSTLADFAAGMLRNSFFCTTDKLEFVRSFTAIRLTLKWRFPCYSAAPNLPDRNPVKTDPFHFQPTIPLLWDADCFIGCEQ